MRSNYSTTWNLLTELLPGPPEHVVDPREGRPQRRVMAQEHILHGRVLDPIVTGLGIDLGAVVGQCCELKPAELESKP